MDNFNHANIMKKAPRPAPIAQKADIFVVTFNCARVLIEEDAFAAELASTRSRNGLSVIPDIIVLSLQEIAPLSKAFIGGTHLLPYWSKFHDAVQNAFKDSLPAEPTQKPYNAVRIHNVGMTAAMVFAREEGNISNVEYGDVGLGLLNMGNKGAAGIRFTYTSSMDSTRATAMSTHLTFVAAHLAPHEYAVERRNEDYRNMARRLIFSSDPSQGPKKSKLRGSMSVEDLPLLTLSPRDATVYKIASTLVFAGDLNYRTSIISPSPTDHIDTFPQPYHHPDSPQHYMNYLDNDQLNAERQAGRTCHGLHEADIRFPPTYKYDTNLESSDDKIWHWSKHRWPSWCDRILFTNESNNSVVFYEPLDILKTSDHRPVALGLSVSLTSQYTILEEEAADIPDFGIDVDWKIKKDRAAKLELIIGYAAYLTTTGEGALVGVLILFSLGLAVMGAYFGFRVLA